MSVSTTARKQQFTLNGTTSTLTFTFRALVNAPTDIKVTVTAGGVETALTYTTDYTVAVNADGVGGVVTLIDPAGVGSGTATVYRETTNTQGSDYDDYNQFPADTIETDLDIRTLVSQEQAEETDRSLILPISVTGVSTELPVPAADKVLGWDSAGTALENKTFVPSTDLEKASVADAVAGSDDIKYMTPSISSIAILTAKTAPVPADSVRINDSEATNALKKSTITQLTTALDINSLTEKASPVNADELLLSDSEASNAKKKVLISSLGGANLVQRVNTQTGTVTTGTTAIASDDSIPQITEGDEYMTLAITPTSTVNTLKIDVVLIGAHSDGAEGIVALFRDAIADALAAVVHNLNPANNSNAIGFTHSMTVGTLSVTTFRVRAGAPGGATFTFNGVSGGRLMGGVMASSITITETKP